MSKKFQSQQEAILQAVCEFSMAAPFVFAPDCFYKGNGSPREPADLVWACNNTVIIMHMKASDTSSSEKNIKKREHLIEKNLGQAKGWLKNWKNGRPLVGSNDYCNYSIDYSPDLHIVFLSIIKCQEAIGRFHGDLARQLGISLCATLPQSVVELITSYGGTALDLLCISEMIKQEIDVSEEKLLSSINGYFQDCLSLYQLQQAPPASPSDWARILHPLLAVRTPRSLISSTAPKCNACSGSPHKGSGILNDLELIETHRIASSIWNGLQTVKEMPSGFYGAGLELSHYNCLVMVADTLNPRCPGIIGETMKQWNDAQRLKARPSLTIIHDIHVGYSTIAVDDANKPTATETWLKQFKTQNSLA